MTFPAAKGRYLALEVLSVQGEGPAAIAEVELVGSDGKKLPRIEPGAPGQIKDFRLYLKS